MSTCNSELDKCLEDKQKPWTKYLAMAEEKTNVPRKYIFLGELYFRVLSLRDISHRQDSRWTRLIPPLNDDDPAERAMSESSRSLHGRKNIILANISLHNLIYSCCCCCFKSRIYVPRTTCQVIKHCNLISNAQS